MFATLLQKIVFFSALLVVLLLAGFLCARLQVFPYAYLSPLADAIEGRLYTMNIAKHNETLRWEKTNKSAGSTADTSLAFQGYTLVASTQETALLLVDMSGATVHRWQFSFNALWPEQEHLIAPRKLEDSYFYVRDAELYPDGSIIAIICAGGLTPWGAGLVKIDAQSNVVWKSAGFYFSDITQSRFSTDIYVLQQEVRKTKLKDVSSVRPPYLDDGIVVIDQNGNIQKRISIIDALRASPFKRLISDILPDPLGDYLHSNTIDEIAYTSNRVAWIRQGHLIVTLRDASAFAVIDPKTGKVEHAAYLPLRLPHDIRLMPDEKLTAFDNAGNLGDGGASRLVEMSAETLGIEWHYSGTLQEPLSSDILGSAQRLENGNFLTSNPKRARIFEITRDGKLAWEYFLPDNKGGLSPRVTVARRYQAQDLPFLTEEIKK